MPNSQEANTVTAIECQNHVYLSIGTSRKFAIWVRSNSTSWTHNNYTGFHLTPFRPAYTVLFFSRPRSEGWPHHGRTFSTYPCPLSFWLTLPQRVLSTSWCCPSRPCVVFLACVHLALFLALSLSPAYTVSTLMADFHVNLRPDLQNILRQSYNYLTIKPKLRSTYNGHLIYRTSYEGYKAVLR